MLGITHIKIASDERLVYDAMMRYLHDNSRYCVHDLVAAYFLMNPGEKSLDKKTLDNFSGLVKSYVYWMCIQKSCDEIPNYLYRYSPEDDVIYMKGYRKATEADISKKPSRGRPKGSKNRK